VDGAASSDAAVSSGAAGGSAESTDGSADSTGVPTGSAAATGGSAATTGSPSGGVGDESVAGAAGGSSAAGDPPAVSVVGVHGRGVNTLSDGGEAGGGVASVAGGDVGVNAEGVGAEAGGGVGADADGVEADGVGSLGRGGRYSSRLMSSARGGPSPVLPLLLAGVAALALPAAGPLPASLAVSLAGLPVPLTGPSGLAITVVSRGAGSAGAVSAAGGR
jgi:hypothetical protein